MMNDDFLVIAAEIAEWSDRMTEAANKMLNRGENEEVIALRSLISEWIDRFNDVSFDIQNTVLAGNGWAQKEQDGLWGWIDPNTKVHYLPKDAIALQRLRSRKRDTEPLAYN